MTDTKALQERLKELADDLGEHANMTEDPKCAALCETSREVVSGLETAFNHYHEKSEPAWH